jgi:hypothetical protein
MPLIYSWNVTPAEGEARVAGVTSDKSRALETAGALLIAGKACSAQVEAVWHSTAFGLPGLAYVPSGLSWQATRPSSGSVQWLRARPGTTDD